MITPRKTVAKVLLFIPSIFYYKEEWSKNILHRNYYNKLVREFRVPCPERHDILHNIFVNYFYVFGTAIWFLGICGGIRQVRLLKKLRKSKSEILADTKIKAEFLENPHPGSNLNLNPEFYEHPYPRKPTSYREISLETIKRAIADPGIKVISFDIFDTLLVRAVLDPSDVFKLVAKEIDRKYGIDFFKVRSSAEGKIGNLNCTLDDIYSYIQKVTNLSRESIVNVKSLEIRYEEALLFKRPIGFELYKEALRCGKSIIAVSDMYLGGDRLNAILQEKGYKSIEKIFCSCDFKARKDNGRLYDIVMECLAQKGIRKNEILHIGDNLVSDCVIPLKKEILAFNVPSNKSLLMKEGTLWNQVYSLITKKSTPTERIFIGYALNKYDVFFSEPSPHLFPNLKAFTQLAFAPVIIASALKIIESKQIQQNYSEILFGSRDGFLLKKIYDVFRIKLKKGVGSAYVQTGRRAFLASLWKNDFDKFLSLDGLNPSTELVSSLTPVVAIEKFFSANPKLQRELISRLREVTRNPKFGTKEYASELRKYEKEILEFYSLQAKASKKYYLNYLGGEKKIIFDMGYSGSIGKGIFRSTGKKIDKIYMWDTKANKECDEKLETKTKTLIGSLEEIPFTAFHLIFEELCSPPEGGCIGFDAEGNPILEKINISSLMKQDLACIQEETVSFAETFLEDVAIDSIENLKRDDWEINGLLSPLAYIIKSPYCEINLLRNIAFYDVICKDQECLSQKLDYSENFASQIMGTGFINPDNFISCDDFTFELNTSSSPRILVHIHLFYVELSQEFIHYLSNIRTDFDILITSSSQEVGSIFERMCRICLPSLRKSYVEIVPNRGRDVAPFYIEAAKFQHNYDLMLHIHGKKTVHADHGDRWRNSMIDNLLCKKKINEIFYLFEKHPNIGLILPPPFHEVIKIWNRSNLTVIGENRKHLDEIYRKLSTLEHPELFTRGDLVFSIGNMFWTRTKAVEPLFNLQLRYEDFPEEPIPIDGTLAHSIERAIFVSAKTANLEIKFISDR